MLYATNLCVVEEGLLSAFNNFASRLVTIMFLFPRAQISFMRDVKYLAYECRQKKSTDRSEQQQLREGVRERGPEGQRKKKRPVSLLQRTNRFCNLYELRTVHGKNRVKWIFKSANYCLRASYFLH